MRVVQYFLITFASFIVIDLLWLGVIAQSLYQTTIGEFLAETPNWPAAIVFYLLFVVGLMYFSLWPALKIKSLELAMKNGALYGFFTYMTYELTNYAVLAGWPLSIVFIDVLWGTLLGFSVSAISYRIITSLRLDNN